MVRAATAAAWILLCGGCSQETFFCDTPEDCASAGGGGACESAEDVYAADGGHVIRVGKDGTGESLLLTTGGLIRGMTADDTHLYVTDIEAGNVGRLSLFDDEVPAQIATSPGAWGIATDCTHVFWCENGTLSVRRQLK